MTHKSELVFDIQRVIVETIRKELETSFRDVILTRLSTGESPKQPPDTAGYYISRKTVAFRLSLSTQTVDRLIKRGALPASRVGRQILIKESDLQLLISSGAIDTSIVKEVN